MKLTGFVRDQLQRLYRNLYIMRIKKKNLIILIGGAAFILLAVTGYLLATSQQSVNEKKSMAKSQNLKETTNTLAGLKSGDVAEIIIMTASGNKHALTLSQEERSKMIFFSVPSNINLAQENGYTITYHISDQENSFTDISLNVDRKKSEVNALYKGLPLNSTAGMQVDAFLAHSDVPVDWAGHLTLNSEINANDPARICITMDNPESDMIICHNKPGAAS